LENTRCKVDVANAQYEYNPAAFVVIEIINQHFGFLDDEKNQEVHTECLKVKALKIFKVEKEKHLEKYFSEKSGALVRFNLSKRFSRLCYRKVESSEAPLKQKKTQILSIFFLRH
tara:strand:- start:1726 stop:2070 length:345 start_codon:yes stop_codon:yes gene_type:complete